MSEEIIDIIVDERIIVKKKSNKRYINGISMHNALINYYIECENYELNGWKSNYPKNPPVIPNYIGECIMMIAEKLSSKVNFSSYSFKQEMVSDAIEKMVEAVVQQKYDASISQNPFAYFSQISWNSFLQRLRKEKIELYIKHKNMDSLLYDDDFLEINYDNDIHNKVLEDFEKPKARNSAGYTPHRNHSYAPNRAKKGRKIKDLESKITE